MSPMLLFFLFSLVWLLVIPWWGGFISYSYSMLLLFAFLGVRAYGIILSGWNIIRSFSKIGGVRSILQSLSYEVRLILAFLVGAVCFSSLRINRVNSGGLLLLRRVLWIWLILSLLETNRAPFDLLEGERELISGFNVEIGRLLFVYLFLAEYGMVIIIALLIRSLVLTKERWLSLVISLIILLARRCYPRVRYDILMGLIWQIILPISLVFMLFLKRVN